MLRELGVSDKYFYYMSSGPGATMDMRAVLRFKAPADRQALLKAAEDTLFLFPEYSVRPVLTNNRVYYEENHNPVALLKSSQRYDFGTDDMNGYPFCFQLDPSSEREVVFSYFHGLTDFNGMGRFLKTLICRYAVRVKGLPDDAFRDEIRTQPPSRDEWETPENLDPYAVYARQDTDAPGKPDLSGEIFYPSQEYYDTDSPASRLYRITLRTSEFLRTAKAHHTGFAPYLLYLLSNAVREAYETDKIITIHFPVDLRNVFKTDCIVNFSDSLVVSSSALEHSAPIEEQCRRYRQIIDTMRQPEHYTGLLYNKVQSIKDFEAAPEGITARSHWQTTQPADYMKSISQIVTYLRFPDIPEAADELLENVVLELAFGVSFLQVSTYRDEMSITSVQRFDGDQFVKAIQRKLSSEGFASRLTDRGLIEHNTMNLEKLKKL